MSLDLTRPPEAKAKPSPTSEDDGGEDKKAPEPQTSLIEKFVEWLKKSRITTGVIVAVTTAACIWAANSYAGFSTKDLFQRWETWLVVLSAFTLITLGWTEGRSFSKVIRFLTVTFMISGIVHFAISVVYPTWSFEGQLQAPLNRAIADAESLRFDIVQFLGDEKVEEIETKEKKEIPNLTLEQALQRVKVNRLREEFQQAVSTSSPNKKQVEEVVQKLFHAKKVLARASVGVNNNPPQPTPSPRREVRVLPLAGAMPNSASPTLGFTGITLNSGDRIELRRSTTQLWWQPSLASEFSTKKGQFNSFTALGYGGLYLYSKESGSVEVTIIRAK